MTQKFYFNSYPYLHNTLLSVSISIIIFGDDGIKKEVLKFHQKYKYVLRFLCKVVHLRMIKILSRFY